VAAVLYGAASQNSLLLSQHDYLSVTILTLVLTWLGIFVLCYGSASFRAAAFPLLFLLMMVPVPELLLGRIISALQEGSAAVAHRLFELSGVPTYRDGFFFTLPGLTIEVAEECSGIRSSIGLLVTSLLAGHLFLRSGWGKISLTLSIIPLAMLKNALRIVVITLLGIYVDGGFLTGNLHRRGGIVFFLLSLPLLAIFLGMLQRFENRNRRDDGTPSPPSTNSGDADGRPAQGLSRH
jgi:exosortase